MKIIAGDPEEGRDDDEEVVEDASNDPRGGGSTAHGPAPTTPADRDRAPAVPTGVAGHPRRTALGPSALELNREMLRLDRPGLELLTYAVRHHSEGLLEADITVQTCWDADRLDLGRVGKTPRVEKLCTEQARDPVLFDIAYRRSLR